MGVPVSCNGRTTCHELWLNCQKIALKLGPWNCKMTLERPSPGLLMCLAKQITRQPQATETPIATQPCLTVTHRRGAMMFPVIRQQETSNIQPTATAHLERSRLIQSAAMPLKPQTMA